MRSVINEVIKSLVIASLPGGRLYRWFVASVIIFPSFCIRMFGSDSQIPAGVYEGTVREFRKSGNSFSLVDGSSFTLWINPTNWTVSIHNSLNPTSIRIFTMNDGRFVTRSKDTSNGVARATDVITLSEGPYPVLDWTKFAHVWWAYLRPDVSKLRSKTLLPEASPFPFADENWLATRFNATNGGGSLEWMNGGKTLRPTPKGPGWVDNPEKLKKGYVQCRMRYQASDRLAEPVIFEFISHRPDSTILTNSYSVVSMGLLSGSDQYSAPRIYDGESRVFVHDGTAANKDNQKFVRYSITPTNSRLWTMRKTTEAQSDPRLTEGYTGVRKLSGKAWVLPVLAFFAIAIATIFVRNRNQNKS